MRAAPLPILAALSAVVALALPGAARADMRITQHVLDGDGWPLLVANEQPTGAATPTWKRCTPECGAAEFTGNPYKPGPSSPGTVFQASGTTGDVTTSSGSRVWNGRVTNTAPPTLGGEIKIGALVTAAPGTWTGGWANDYSRPAVRACKAADGTGCVLLSDTPNGTIDKAYAGWFIGSIDQRTAAEQAIAVASVVLSPGKVSPIPSPAPGQTVAMGALSAAVPPLPVPKASVRKVAVLRKKQLILGTVSCVNACVAHVKVTQGKRKLAFDVKVAAGGKATIQVPVKRFKRDGGKLTLAVRYDDSTRTTKTKIRAR